MATTLKNKLPGYSTKVFEKAFKRYKSCNTDYGQFRDPISQKFIEAARDKGRLGEMYVQDMFEELGFQTKILNGYARHDLEVKVGRKWMRVEVKTAAAYIKKTCINELYTFSGIKPEYFDLIAFVCVGYDSTMIKIIGKNKDFIECWGSDDGRGGYTIVLNHHRKHCKEFGQEIFLAFNKKNVKLALK